MNNIPCNLIVPGNMWPKGLKSQKVNWLMNIFFKVGNNLAEKYNEDTCLCIVA